LERCNARNLTADLVPDAPSVIVCDASFIPLRKVLPAALSLCKAPSTLIALIKPQFEAKKDEVESGTGGDRIFSSHRIFQMKLTCPFDSCSKYIGERTNLPRSCGMDRELGASRWQQLAQPGGDGKSDYGPQWERRVHPLCCAAMRLGRDGSAATNRTAQGGCCLQTRWTRIDRPGGATQARASALRI
jgi:hypothetical protein